MLNKAQKIKGIPPIEIKNKPLKNIRHTEHNLTFSTSDCIRFTTKTAKEIEPLAGIYGTFGMYMTVAQDSNALKINIMGQQFYLLPVEHDEFIPAGGNDRKMVNPKNRFYFEEEYNHKIIIVKDEWGNTTSWLKR